MDFETYKDLLLSYLHDTEDYEKQDIEDHKNLSDDEKEDFGYMIKDAIVIEDDGKGNVKLCPKQNYTRWRTGDTVQYTTSSPLVVTGTATITDNFENCICLTGMPHNAKLFETFSLSIIEPQMTALFISTINNIVDGGAGSFYIEELAGLEEPDKEYGNPVTHDLEITKNLNAEQQEAVINILKRPSLYAIQGPPGTGKTSVLSAIAKLYSDEGKDVLIISNSHQAVNNALNKILQYNLPTFKIGNEFKAISLHPDVKRAPTMREYAKFKKGCKSRTKTQSSGDVVGMTLCGSILNLALHKHAFTPSIVLIDEASQIPLCLGAAIGGLVGGTYVFIGDDRQMPPIFHKKMSENPFSISIFDHLQRILPSELKTSLTTTYRMNSTICHYVSEQFYEPYGVKLFSHPSIAENHVAGENLNDSIEFININTSNCQDCNRDEAQEAVAQALKYQKLGLEVSIITPYKKQVNLVREEWFKSEGLPSDIQIDTVERLQGQDVDVIILTMSASDINYYKTQDAFLLDRNRLNVMISRARIKVIVIKSPIIVFSVPNGISPEEIPNADNGMFFVKGEPAEVAEARRLILESFKDLHFIEEGHHYYLNGKELHSVSGIGHRYLSRPFDVDKQAILYSLKHGNTAEFWKDQWVCNSFRATTLGRKTHEFGESLSYLMAGHPERILPSIKPQYFQSKNYLADIHPKESAVRLFLYELPSCYHLVLNETKVYSGKNLDASKNLKEQICGTFDMLYWYDGNGNPDKAGFVVFDYKTNAKLIDNYNREHGIMLLPPFDEFYQESLGEYTIQLSLYSLMLEDIGLKVIDRKLIWLKDDGTYEKIDVPDITHILRRTL